MTSYQYRKDANRIKRIRQARIQSIKHFLFDAMALGSLFGMLWLLNAITFGFCL